MKFKYSRIPLPGPSSALGSVLFKPIIPIIISHRERAIRYGALLDSGADFCMFDGLVGEYLGIDVRSGARERFGGVEEGAGLEAYFHPVTLKLGTLHREVTVGFSYDIANHGFAVLGQIGFFDGFRVLFDLQKDEIDIKPKR